MLETGGGSLRSPCRPKGSGTAQRASRSHAPYFISRTARFRNRSGRPVRKSRPSSEPDLPPLRPGTFTETRTDRRRESRDEPREHAIRRRSSSALRLRPRFRVGIEAGNDDRRRRSTAQRDAMKSWQRAHAIARQRGECRAETGVCLFVDRRDVGPMTSAIFRRSTDRRKAGRYRSPSRATSRPRPAYLVERVREQPAIRPDFLLRPGASRGVGPVIPRDNRADHVGPLATTGIKRRGLPWVGGAIQIDPASEGRWAVD